MTRLVIISDPHCGHRAGLTPPGWQSPREGVTVAEICEATGVSVNKAREAVRSALRKGECRATKKMVAAMDGRVMPVPSYFFEGVV